MTLASLESIPDMASYLTTFQSALAKKCNDLFEPLHTPGVDPLPDFSEYKRQPYEAQAHLIAANVRLLEEVGAGFINGEVGTGKSIAAIMVIHEHAKRRGPKGYRAIVMCPDHILEKWKKKELEPTLPGVEVIILDKWHDFLDLAPPQGKIGARKRWPKADHPVWLIVGRNQIKHTPGTIGIGPVSSRRAIKKVRRDDGTKEKIIIQYASCPKCGKVVTSKTGPLSPGDMLKKTEKCKGISLVEIGGCDRLTQTTRYVDRDNDPFPAEHASARPGTEVEYSGKQWRVVACGEQLYSWAGKPRRWPAARIIQSRLKGWADYMIIDECHESKSDTSARSMAFGKVLASTKYCLALTGTLTGGQADHLFPLCLRMNPQDVISRGFAWGQPKPWVQAYGCIDTVVTSKGAAPESGIAEGARSMRRQKLEETGRQDKFRPGIMPSIYPDILMHQTTFLRLEQFIDNLPGNDERVSCEGGGEDPIFLDDIHQTEYTRVANVLKNENSKLLATGNTKLMSAMNWTLLAYPDYPWGWDSIFPVSGTTHKRHAVGWWQIPKLYTEGNFNGVVTPKNLSWDITLPKEQRLIEICQRNHRAGEQTWVYCMLTKKYNCLERLRQKLEASGLKVGVLPDGDVVAPRERYDWINTNGPKYDVILSHPTPVCTGFDFFDYQEKIGKYRFNFNHLVFYQTGYEPLIMRQAAGRARRIGQNRDCTVTYLYYTGTAQEAALLLAGRKAAAAIQLEEGRICETGLGATGGGNAQSALIKAIGEAIDPNEIRLHWKRTSNPGARVANGTRGGRANLALDGRAAATVRLPEALDIPVEGTSGVAVHGVQRPSKRKVKVPIRNEDNADEQLIKFFSRLGQPVRPAGKPGVQQKWEW